MHVRRSFIAASALALATASFALAAPAGTLEVQILAINDFHGNLAPPAGSSGRVGSTNAGGIEYLATHIADLRAQNPNTAVVSAGDMIGASPLLSALFHDEPTIEAFNLIGLDYNAVGNHEFDEGIAELIRMQDGGCHPVDGCLDNDDFAGAEFRFLAANVKWKKNGKPVFPAYKTKAFNGVQVAFIGMTLEGTPSIVSPSGIAQLRFEDEADTVNALIPELKQRGVEAIVVVVHEGARQAAPAPYNGCTGISGPIVDIVNRMDDAVDVIITGHTHQPYNCTIDGKLVTSAFSFGRLVTKIDLTIDRATRDVVAKVADNRIVTRDVPKDPRLTSLIGKYEAIATPLTNRVIGSIGEDISLTSNVAGESALGDVIADAQLYATAPAGLGDAVVAFMNPGGIRADLTYASSGAGEGDGNVTYGEAFTVQPFGNSLVTMTLTGAQIELLLEQQFMGCPNNQPFNRILQVSAGLEYAWSAAGPACDKVDPQTIRVNDLAIDLNASYRVTVNSFLADGGDNFSVLTQGTNRLGGAVDVDALEAYFGAFSPVMPGPRNRITVLP
jgi:5'-nucleotidase